MRRLVRFDRREEVEKRWVKLRFLDTASEIVVSVNPLEMFREHINSGMRPFFCEGEYTQRLLATLEKSIYHDTPYFLPQIQEQHLRLMNAVVALLATAAVPTLNIDSLCRSAQLKVFAPKDDSDGDLIIGGELFEVGGRDKKRKNAKRVIRDDIELPTASAIPLWMIGWLY